jgi:methionyl-tRNA synthetase
MMNLLDDFIRNLNKTFSARMKEAGENAEIIASSLADALHTLRVAAVLSHPVVPGGTEMIADYFAGAEKENGVRPPFDFFSWEHINTPPDELYPAGHTFKFLEPRVDFFERHTSQIV